METDFSLANIDQNTPLKDTASDDGFLEGTNKQAPFDLNRKARVKTHQRMHYEAQVNVIRHQIGGDLEAVRLKLGLSQRKICQLLLVDPSAWSRWTNALDGREIQAPPHIYRALQWYMTLQEKIPGLTPQYFIGKDPEVLHQQALSRVEKLESKLESSIQLKADANSLAVQMQINASLELKIKDLENQIRANRVGFFMVVGAILLLTISGLFFLRVFPLGGH